MGEGVYRVYRANGVVPLHRGSSGGSRCIGGGREYGHRVEHPGNTHLDLPGSPLPHRFDLDLPGVFQRRDAAGGAEAAVLTLHQASGFMLLGEYCRERFERVLGRGEPVVSKFEGLGQGWVASVVSQSGRRWLIRAPRSPCMPRTPTAHILHSTFRGIWLITSPPHGIPDRKGGACISRTF